MTKNLFSTKSTVVLAAITLLASFLVAGSAQAAQTSPSVTGTTQVGSTLTVTPGTWDSGKAQTQQWFRDGLAIPGATSTTYTLTPSDYLRAITVVVMGTRSSKPAVEFAPLLPLISAAPESPAASPMTVAQIFTDFELEQTCALVPTGQVQCIVSSTIKSPVTLKGISNAVALSGNCALVLDGSVYCWGRLYTGNQKFNPNPKNDLTKVVKIAGLKDVRAISVGSTRCALIKDGTEACFGRAEAGELASVKLDSYFNGMETLHYKNTPQVIPGVTNAIQISSAYAHNCALQASKTVLCWGKNPEAKYGDNSNVQYKGVTKVAGITGAIQLYTSQMATCVLLDNGDAKCWGAQTGTKTKLKFAGSATVTSLSIIERRSTGTGCALMSDQTLQCFDNYRFEAVPVTLPLGVLAIGKRYEDRPCAILLSGEAYCWNVVYEDMSPAITQFQETPVSSTLWGTTPMLADLFGVERLNNPKVSITGKPVLGSPLTGVVGSYPEGTTLIYNWYTYYVQSTEANPSAPLADGLTFTIPMNHPFPVIFQVIAKVPGYRTVVTTSAPTADAVPGPIPLTSTPVITASAVDIKAGVTLTASPGTWTENTSFAYTWLRNGVAIKGATKAKFVLTKADAGASISVRVKGTNPDAGFTGYIPVTLTSAAVSVSK